VSDPFRDDSALAARVARIERELAETREELARELATSPVNGDAFTRRLQEENDELRRWRGELQEELTRLRRQVREQSGRGADALSSLLGLIDLD
jgi:septal ring factor EnvC (AmiA/AmiB activator)